MSTPLWSRVIGGIRGKSTKAQATTPGFRFLDGSPTVPPEDIIYGSRVLRSPTAIVHLEYDPEALESKPSSEWTRFVCISDTHGHAFKVPDGDVLLHSGDLTNTGKVPEFEKTVNWLCELPHPVKIIIAGNHDLALHEGWYDVNFMKWNQPKQNISKIKELLKGRHATSKGLVYLQDDEYSFQVKRGGRKWSIYGSPWSPYFHNWAFNYKREDGKELVSKFPKTDILLTHGPPFGIFDATRSEDWAGCEDLRYRLEELQPRLHVFGHIHEAHGAHIHPWVQNADGHYESPLVQNEEAGGDRGGEAKEQMDSNREEVHATVFANAAVFALQGKGTKQRATRGPRSSPPVGGPGFQPIVVDLKD